ncbi:hypothetical protein IO476_000062 [Campylobacter coli]|nr:hypothetical protein [Campylobacter coli]HEB9316481.1 hypothetical protein [Campylobacter coli]HEC1743188.1 hypothetical protein [Campylobacter coli]
MKKIILISSILSSFFIFAEANELPSDEIQPEVKVIKEYFQNKVDKVEFEAWAKGMGLNFSTQKYLNNRNYKKYAKTMAKLIRKTRGVEGKVEICYEGTPKKRVHKCNKF